MTAPTVSDRPGEGLAQRYRQVREASERLAARLCPEDMVVQSMPDVSPTKWHLAHTTWFFETFVLAAVEPDVAPFDPDFAYLFNSYYEAVGPRHARPKRGLLSRPTADQVFAYRAAVDERMQALLTSRDATDLAGIADTIVLGLNHEQQHQELSLMDIKHVFAQSPLMPAYDRRRPEAAAAPRDLGWVDFAGGPARLGADGAGFHFDNETPAHDTLLVPFSLADRLVTNRDWLAFVEDGGYRAPGPWLSDGWAWVQAEGVEAPLYWFERDGAWHEFTLCGAHPLQLDAPVVHVSYYEADAFARWAEARLPTEAEWERAAAAAPVQGNLLEEGRLHPAPAPEGAGLRQLFGDVWEWTQSPYAAYPGFRPLPGAVGEYNGKFMCNQQVLRGGACVTPASHLRATYRNFFYPHQRWCFAGLRLARDRR